MTRMTAEWRGSPSGIDIIKACRRPKRKDDWQKKKKKKMEYGVIQRAGSRKGGRMTAVGDIGWIQWKNGSTEGRSEGGRSRKDHQKGKEGWGRAGGCL